MKRILSLSIALIAAGFLAITAQNNFPMPQRLNRPGARFICSDIGQQFQLPTIKKIELGQDWWQPDTVYCFNPIEYSEENGIVHRFIFKYGSQGLLEGELSQYWENNSWGNYTSNTYTYTYDFKNNVLTKLSQRWSYNSLVDTSLFTYTYDSNNNMLTELSQGWSNNSWENVSLNTYTYDSNNNMLTKLSQGWSNNSWSWVNTSLDTYTYDSNNNMLTELSQIWSNNSWSWVNSTLSTYAYDSTNNMLTALSQNWSTISWVNASLTTYTYDSNNNMLSEQWIDYSIPYSELYTYTYDSENRLLTSLLQLAWELGNDTSWKNASLTTYTYDSNNNMLTELLQAWRNNSWVNYSQNLMIYDENGNGISTKYWIWAWPGEGWLPTASKDEPVILYYNNMQGCFSSSEHRITASYVKVSGINTAIAKLPATPEPNTVSIYPNPTTGELKIKNGELKIQQVTIFDMFGVRVLKTQQTTFDVSPLPAGIYFVQITTEKGIVTKKLVKK